MNAGPHRARRALRPVRAGSLLLIAGLAVFGCGEDDTSGVASADGAIVVRDAWVYATPPSVTEAAVYLVVRNDGGVADHLDGAQSGRCMSIMAHETTIDDEQVSRMQEVDPSRLEVAPGGELALEPRGLHLMCTGLAAPLVAGDVWEVQIGFDHAGAVTVPVEVRPLG